MRPAVIAAISALLAMVAAAPVWAGPAAEFNTQFDATYASYRQALFATNTDKVENAIRTTGQFLERWAALKERYGTAPPPQFAEDPAWKTALGDVERLGREAQAKIGARDLAAAHETLEQVRDVLSGLRRRNGVVTYSDFMNAFHEHMEHVLTAYRMPLPADGFGTLREDAAVLRALTTPLRERAPAAFVQDAAFQETLGSLEAVVERLQRGARLGAGQDVGDTLKALKPAYAKLFVRWG